MKVKNMLQMAGHVQLSTPFYLSKKSNFFSIRLLVLELALALERPRDHKLDGDVLASVWDCAEEHGPGAALAKSVRRRERVGRSAEDGVGVPVGGLGVGFRGSLLPGDFSEAYQEEDEEREGDGGGGGGERVGEAAADVGLRLRTSCGRWRWGVKELAHRGDQRQSEELKGEEEESVYNKK
ncbi:hypothetical protein C1H46_041810 [Malus baccata]|uniref:Uncharacterized protein n=1 Tax=Malus baccata TaxID=106549 RepID=A0A540KFB0_MALBA|nr:hypothetical protein C1H46_041810 [Malus baccata]